MSQWTRRDLLKSGFSASAAAISPSTVFPLSEPGHNGSELITSAVSVVNAADASSARERLLMDFGWKFHLGNACNPDQDFGFGKTQRHGLFAQTGEFPTVAQLLFDDSNWRSVDVPHDWAVELPFENAPFLPERGGKPLGRQYPETSIGWYRRTFNIPSSDLGKRIVLEFEGVFRHSMVMLNGNFIVEEFSGYAPFHCDVTDFITYGGENLLAVRVDATEGEGWFYEGAGIYRHVWLTKTDALHVAHDGTFIRSKVKESHAFVNFDVEVQNDGDAARICRVATHVIDSKGRSVATSVSKVADIAPRTTQVIESGLTFPSPHLWSVNDPYLYRAVVQVENNGALIDSVEVPFGVRTVRFDATRGFFLNGAPLKIKGTCNHQDHAGVGVAVPDSIQSHRVSRLKSMGSNACRTSHNPAAPAFLDACDHLGMVVMGETRMFSSTPEGLNQLERMIRRDRNHPSIIIWSLGNEEPLQGTSRGRMIARTMKHLVKRLDPTRPVTVAMNGAWGEGVSDVVDVQGCNYGNDKVDEFHKKFPYQPMIGTETASTVCTRGIYYNDKAKGYVRAYGRNHPNWGATAEEWWKVYGERPFLAGGFVWTGFDYRGEPTPYSWPCISSHFGILDTCGFPKDNYFYYKAWWGNDPVLHLFPHWNWNGKEGQPIDVWCHSNLDNVELFVNGESMGSRQVERNSHVAWSVAYQPGVIEARGIKDGKVILTAQRKTTGATAKLILSADRSTIDADGQDTSVITVEVQDAQGHLVPTANNLVSFDLSGHGKLIGMGNGDPSCHEADKPDSPNAGRRSAFNGLCMIFIQALREEGEFRLRASASGLENAAIAVRCRKQEGISALV